ncbi:MAG TPA: HEAT repeat domain-containing protein [Candidatus Aminicenantes bacterium]|nr:HEAT repeat domain-containing protein [Candidatus Aminicenantes bacterium]HRY66209.1 HEAT repeat domain-containing protein [Candidatus Aminicenantes bacterium]HRZ73123.1 HEAT repeat domain-containing protein [Candidatus Aminicenantes bacterium]
MARRALIGTLLTALATAGLAAILAGPAAGDRPRPPERVFDRSAGTGTLAARFDQVLAEAGRQAAGARPFWVGYAVDRLTGENSHVGSYSGDRWTGEPSIADILAGKTRAEAGMAGAGTVREAASAALDRLDRPDRPEKKVVKPLGLFLRYGDGKSPSPVKVRMSDLDLSLDFEAAPLYWLGKATDVESLALIEGLYGRGRGHEVREDLLAAAGCHGAPRLVLPFLGKILTGDDPDELRKDAAFWIGQQNDAAGLALLSKAARTDRSEEVREGAVFGISQVELPAAADEIIALARGADKHDVRKQAVFWLGQMAVRKSGQTLEGIAAGDADLAIQEQAVFALSELPDGQGVEALIRLAKTHRDARIRKKAVFWLGETDDPRALEALVAIVKGK